MQSRQLPESLPLSSLLIQLDREEALLRECRAGLVCLHAGLRKGEPATATKTPEALASASAATNSLAAERKRIIRQFAREMGLKAQQPTLAELIVALPANLADPLRSRHAVLAELAREINRLHVRCTHLLAFCQVFLNRLMCESMPHSQAGPRYGPAGTPIDSPRVTRVMTRG